jgi:nucleoid DNA-binding protein
MKKLVSLFILPLAMLTLLLACSVEEQVQSSEELSQSVYIEAKLAANFDQMIKETPVIVVGSFEKLVKKYNAARDPKDPTKESKNSVSERNLFDFKVDKVLKGTLSSNVIQVSEPYRFSVTDLTEEQIKARKGLIKEPYYFEPELGKQYVLFLKETEKSPQVYSGSFAIHVLSVSDDQKLFVVKPDPSLSKQTLNINGKTRKVEINTSLEPPKGADGLTLEQLEAKIKQQ